MKSKKLKLVENFKKFNNKSNYIFSALNLAFLAYLALGHIKPTKRYFLWCDGLIGQIYSGIKKTPGSKFIRFFFKYKFTEIVILGNHSNIQIKFLKKKFKTKIRSIVLPKITRKNIKKYAPKVKKNSLILITLPTPKQEMLSDEIIKKNKYYKILCIGGGLSIATGEVKNCPNYISRIGLEFIWRLRTDTFRRISRLLFTLVMFIFYLINGKLKKFTIFKI